MFEGARKAVGGFFKAGVDAARAGINGLFGASEGTSAGENQDVCPVAPQDTDVPVGADKEAVFHPSDFGGAPSEQTACASNDTCSSADAPFWENGIFRRNDQIGLYDFTTDKHVVGFYLNPEERWIRLHDRVFVSSPELAALEAEYFKRAAKVAAETAEQRYAKKVSFLVESKETEEYSGQLSFDALTEAHQKFLAAAAAPVAEADSKSTAGRKLIPFQLALGALIVQSIMRTSDRGTGSAISENPYIQYFCGFSFFSDKNTISHSKLSELKKVFDAEFMEEINEFFLKMHLEEIRLEAKQKAKDEAEKEVNKAKKELQKAESLLKRAEKAASKAANEEDEVKNRLDGTATEEEVEGAHSKTVAAQKKLEDARDAVKKAEKKLENLVGTNGKEAAAAMDGGQGNGEVKDEGVPEAKAEGEHDVRAEAEVKGEDGSEAEAEVKAEDEAEAGAKAEGEHQQAESARIHRLSDDHA